MSDNTKIEWADATVNAVNGCSLASPGCTNCYAMKQAHRFPVRQGLTTKTKGGMVWTGEVRLSETALLQPLKWKRARRIFWNAHGDLFHENVPDEWIDRVFAVCALTPQHTHMILTKRSARMREYLNDRRSATRLLGHALLIEGGTKPTVHTPWPLPNVWLGVSVEDQTRADERIPDLLTTPAAVRFISAEPLLGPVDLNRVKFVDEPGTQAWESALNGKRFDEWGSGPDIEGCCKLDWVIVGGESGPGARPMDPTWATVLRDQCAAAGVAFHFKQWGEWHPSDQHDDCEMKSIMAFREDGTQEWRPIEAGHWASHDDWQGMCKIGKKRAGRLLDGVTHDGLPA